MSVDCVGTFQTVKISVTEDIRAVSVRGIKYNSKSGLPEA